MDLVNTLHMNSGDGESSYANNSFLQETAIRKAIPCLKHAIKGMTSHDVFNRCFTIADLGCSSSTNSLLVASNIMDIVHEVCQENHCKAPQFQVCLNDLFGNDFNTIFKQLPTFYAKLKKGKEENFGPFFISAVPGSFYGRLFPDEYLHFVHSSYSLHWLSQVPEGLESNTINIYMTKTSPQDVLQAYGKQFHTDFTEFLQQRSMEIVSGGGMVLTLLGRSTNNPTSDDCCCILELLAQSLFDMLREGLVRESDINSFNIPIYNPSEDEVKNLIQYEESFSLENMSVFEGNWDPYDTDYTNEKDSEEPSQIHGKNTAKVIRSVLEPLLSSHFGTSIIDVLFKKYRKHVAKHLSNKKTRHFNVTISLIKKINNPCVFYILYNLLRSSVLSCFVISVVYNKYSQPR